MWHVCGGAKGGVRGGGGPTNAVEAATLQRYRLTLQNNEWCEWHHIDCRSAQKNVFEPRKLYSILVSGDSMSFFFTLIHANPSQLVFLLTQF